MTQKYKLKYSGIKYSPDFRIYFENIDGCCISPFHDIPLLNSNGTFNMVCEIPRWSNAKFEVSTDELMNPIKQDTMDGKLRFSHNIFPYHGFLWNYGCLPQTWEDPSQINPYTKCRGDNDPIDAIEIGQAIAYTGEVKEVKILGIIALLDEGETDWKVICIDINDPMANELNDIEDIRLKMPGLLDATIDYMKFFIVPYGKGLNSVAFDEKPLGKDFALQIIEETHQAWKMLVSAQIPAKTNLYDLSVKNYSIQSNTKVTDEEMAKIAIKHSSASYEYEKMPLDDSINKSNYVDRNLSNYC